MGCCLSVSRDHSPSGVITEDPPAEQPTSSRTRTQSTANNGSSGGGPSATARVVVRTAPEHFPLGEHFNAPIHSHVWYSKRRLWTRGQLDHERNEFFETRVAGRAEVWAALHTAITLMQAGDLDTAQGIVDAAGITVPTGDFCQGAYDQHGMLYRLPQCIVSDPENMVRANLPGPEDEFDTTDDGKLSFDEASGDELIAEDMQRRRDEKGKMSERDLIRVKARLSDRDGPDVLVIVGKDQTVGLIARKIYQEAAIPKTHRIRIAYLGKILKEHASLVDQGWKPGNMINALVVARNLP
ncbi:hypothetical protein FE257_006204 [Aspergillus nanangensis]|uniref:Ubiquitin-like domain-containing protein n=1 Tax=Aspergillus nanangensis TaxID=2582783 RepID=A0AAD4CPI0_ASPNN|nr:hypothetical protein FE257_006204 [Aspergillus nanangensis]